MQIIVVCGSVRFKDEMYAFRDEQNKLGNWILLPENMELDVQKIDERVKAAMDGLHLDKIERSDSVLIWNRNGYIGKSTSAELTYARVRGKPIKFLEEVK